MQRDKYSGLGILLDTRIESEGNKMTDYDYDTYCEVMEQALKTMDELLDGFEPHKEAKAEREKR